MNKIRQQRIASAIKEALGGFFLRENNSRISITEVQVSDRLERAKVYYNLLNPTDKDEVQSILTHKQPYYRHLLAQKLNLRSTPLLIFIYDESLERVFRLQQLINQI